MPVLTDDAELLVRSPEIDLIVEVTGTIDFAAGIVLDAIDHKKHIVIVNAELDSLVGPILKKKADAAGVVITNTDGDEPGVAMTLVRYLRGIGLNVVAAGNIKGMVDHYRTPETQREFAARYDQNVWKVTSFADATKLSMETTVLANATGFHVGRRGMYGPPCKDVRELATLLPAEAMLDGGIVDYSLGAEPAHRRFRRGARNESAQVGPAQLLSRWATAHSTCSSRPSTSRTSRSRRRSDARRCSAIRR